MSGTRSVDVAAAADRPDRSAAVVAFGSLAGELEGIDASGPCRVIERPRGGGREFLEPDAQQVGAGADPAAVMQSLDPVPAVVFVATTLGAAAGEPLGVLRALSEREVVPVAVVTMPAAGEPAGRDPRGVVDRVQSAAATTVVVPADDRTPAMRDVVTGIATLMAEPGVINVDLADVRAVLSRGPLAAVTTGRAAVDAASGDDPPAGAAVADALDRVPGEPNGATGALLHLRIGAQTSVAEVVGAVERLRPVLTADGPLIWGVSVDAYRSRISATLVLGYAERPWLETALTAAGRLDAGDPCPRCGGHVARYRFGDRERLACDGCGFTGVDVRLG